MGLEGPGLSPEKLRNVLLIERGDREWILLVNVVQNGLMDKEAV